MIARSCPAIAANPRVMTAGLRRVRDAGMPPTLTSLSLTVSEPTPILDEFPTAPLSASRHCPIPSPPGRSSRHSTESDGCGRNSTAEETPRVAGNRRERPERHQRLPLQVRLRVRAQLSRDLLTA